MEGGVSISSQRIKLFTRLPANTSANPLPPCAALQRPLGLCWPYAAGDFFKDKPEPPMASWSAGESNGGGARPGPSWELKPRSSAAEEILTDGSDLSEGEKANDTLLGYFKKMDLNLKPEKVETLEGSFPAGASEAFPYPDFLPPPLNALDLHELAFSKSESWKALVEPLEGALDPLVTRLLELERLQHSTVQKEKPRPQATCPVVPECPSSKALPKARQPKLGDPPSLQTPCMDKGQEKRKNNTAAAACKAEPNPSRWNWSHSGKCKWTTPSSLRSSSAAKQVMAAYDDLKASKSSTFSPYQDTAAKPPTARESLVKMVSTRCLLPRSPVPVSPVPLAFPEHQKEELKVPRTRKKRCRKSVALNIHHLNCVSPTFIIAKGKCASTEQE